MRFKIAIAILCLLAFTAATAYAATVRISETNYAALGWKKTLINGGAESGQAANFEARTTTTPPGVQAITCSPRKSQTNQLGWAGISAQLFQGIALDTVTTLKIRTSGWEGDGSSWEPPSVYLGMMNTAGNDRSMRALPYASFGRGTAWTYYEYNLLAGKWLNHINGTVYANIAAAEAAQGPLRFTDHATGLPSGQNFNVFNGFALNEEIAYGSSARGSVDWVEIGFSDGSDYIFDFVVPEPSSILALFTGIIGIAAIRRRR